MSQYNQNQYFMLNSKFLFSAFLNVRIIHQQSQFVTLSAIQQQLHTKQLKKENRQLRKKLAYIHKLQSASKKLLKKVIIDSEKL